MGAFMKKYLKLFVLLVLLLFAFSALVACSKNNNTEPDNNYEPEIKEVSLVFTLKDDDTYEVSGHNNNGTVANIPEEYNGKPVTSIGDNSIGVNPDENRHFSNIKSVTIPNSITTIGERAFGDCDKLESITIPDSVTSIGWIAFIGNKALKSITIGKGLTSIGESAFSGCSALESIVVETDSPYMSPEPERGQRNNSGKLKYIVDKIAEIKGVSADEVASVTFANAERLYGLKNGS